MTCFSLVNINLKNLTIPNFQKCCIFSYLSPFIQAQLLPHLIKLVFAQTEELTVPQICSVALYVTG